MELPKWLTGNKSGRSEMIQTPFDKMQTPRDVALKSPGMKDLDKLEADRFSVKNILKVNDEYSRQLGLIGREEIGDELTPAEIKLVLKRYHVGDGPTPSLQSLFRGIIEFGPQKKDK